MNYKIVNGAISYGAETIIEEINLEIKEKDKIAIVGRNGAGKTTLLKAIINPSILEEGIGEERFQLYQQGKPEIGYLKQIDFEEPKKTLLEEILKVYEPILTLEEKINQLAKTLEDKNHPEIIQKYTQAMQQYEFLGGYTYQKEYKTALQKFGFTKKDQEKRMDEFSGGQRTKIAFLKLLLSKPDILLLDEPTNHLDITAIEWLENYLKNYHKAVVIVSHDRMFLDRIVNKVYEIEYATMVEYQGNYTDFERQKRENYQKRKKDYQYQQAEIKRLQAIADRFRYKPTKAKMALSKLKKIEQMTIIEEPNPYDTKTFHANFPLTMESGKMVLTLKDLEIGYQKPIAKLSFTLYQGQKLAIIGENGIGKSTLLKTLEGIIPKLSGELEYGYHVEKGYFDQQMKFETEEDTIFDEMSKTFPQLTTTQIRTLLGTFLFSGEDVFKKIKVLSGGEKARLQLCKILKKGPNLLLLDEPTNHMDILGKESLEEILKNYSGTVIFVSHDRYFVNKIANCILEFQPGKTTFFQGTYQEYKEKQEDKKETTLKIQGKAEEKKEARGKNQYLKNKENQKRKNKMNKLEKEIEENEQKIEEITNEMEKQENQTNYVKLNELQEEIEKINQEIEEKMIYWEELSKEEVE